MDRSRIEAIAGSYACKRVVVVGDLMVDEFLRGTVERISPEAPVPVLKFESHTFVLGGAANVANNIVALGGEAALVGAIGDDFAGERLLEGLSATGIPAESVVVIPERRTTLKTRVVAHTQHVVRIDREEHSAVSPGVEERLVAKVAEALPGASALLISDYNKGTVTSTVAAGAIVAARGLGLPVVVDTKHHNVKQFTGATVMTPNVQEVEQLSGIKVMDESTLAKAARALVDQTDLAALLVTRAERGMSVYMRDGNQADIPAMAIEVHDITGAGDTVAGALVLALAGGEGLVEAARFANLAAAVVVRKVGTATATVGEMAAFAGAGD